MEIDIRIITVPVEERLSNVLKLKEQLDIPDEKIFCDKEYKGCAWNSKRAFTYPSDKSHILVLSDDSCICDDFLSIVNKIINLHPDSIITLFDYYGIHENEIPYKVVKNKQLTGQAIIIPQKRIDSIFNFTYSSFYSTRADDTHIILAAKHFGYEVLLVVPNIVDSVCLSSTIGNDGGIKSKTFRQDLSNVDWDCPLVEEIYCH